MNVLGGLIIPSVVSRSQCVAKISTDPSITDMEKIGVIPFLRQFKMRGKFLQECAFKQKLDGVQAAAKKKPVTLKRRFFRLAGSCNSFPGSSNQTPAASWLTYHQVASGQSRLRG